MEPIEISAGSVCLDYTLTHFQRVMNPIERLFTACIVIGISIAHVYVLIHVPGAWPTGYLVTGLGLLVLYVLLGSITLSFIMEVCVPNYQVTVIITGQYAVIRQHGYVWQWDLRLLKVSKGLFRTHIIRNLPAGMSVVLDLPRL